MTRTEVDYDHHRLLAEWDPVERHAELRGACPVAFTERHGGYWVVTSHERVTWCGQHPDALTSDHDLDGTRGGREFGGIAIPPQSSYRSLPAEIDGAGHLQFRRLLQPALAPNTAGEWAALAREWTRQCIDPHLATGRIDLVLDIANPVPAMVTLALVGLPAGEWRRYAEPLHALVYTEPTSEARAGLLTTIGELRDALAELVAERRSRPRDDLASTIAASAVDGRPISDADVVNVLFTVISGGLDTTTALVANALVWLDEHRGVRSRLIEEPSVRTSAREEFLRVFSPAPATARTATATVEVGDQTLRRGERVLLSWTSANRDPRVFADPDRLDVDRSNNRHVAFGVGPHRCIGASLARSTFDGILDVVLDQIPDYVVDRDRAERYARVGAVNGWVSIPATFAARAQT
ncbi:MAG: cytochrome P450 [Acidimicrobiales bacterium]